MMKIFLNLFIQDEKLLGVEDLVWIYRGSQPDCILESPWVGAGMLIGLWNPP